MKTGFDRLYTSSSCVWGLKADRYLAMFLDKAPKGNALDVGCGEGRHTLFLAQNGYTVNAIDNSQKAIEKLQQLTEEYNVRPCITAKVADIRTIDLPENQYDIAVISYVFPFLKRSDILNILKKVKTSLKVNGCIYISAITTDDDEYQQYLKEQSPVEPRTFFSPGLKCYYYFFEPGELKTLCTDFCIIDYTETVVALKRPPYTHAMCLIFAQKVV